MMAQLYELAVTAWQCLSGLDDLSGGCWLLVQQQQQQQQQRQQQQQQQQQQSLWLSGLHFRFIDADVPGCSSNAFGRASLAIVVISVCNSNSLWHQCKDSGQPGTVRTSLATSAT